MAGSHQLLNQTSGKYNLIYSDNRLKWQYFRCWCIQLHYWAAHIQVQLRLPTRLGGTNYDPITVAFNNVTTAGTYAKATAGQHPNLGQVYNPASKDVNLYWTLTGGGGLAFNNYNATFNFVAGDIMESADTSNFIVGNYSSFCLVVSPWALKPPRGPRQLE